MIGATDNTRTSGDSSNAPASPTATSHSQQSVTVVASSQPSPLTDSGFEATREVLDDDDDDEDDDDNDDDTEGVLEPKYDLEKPLRGWPQLAKLISVTPGFEAFPAFTDLNLKSLLYYQAEITRLRQKLHEAEYADHQSLNISGLEPRSYVKRLDKMFFSRDKEFENKPNLQRQWLLIKEIRGLLKEYNEALIQYSQVSAFPKADHYNVESLRLWLREVGKYPIQGPGADTWGDLREDPEDPKPLFKHFLHLLCGLVWTPKLKKDKPQLDLIVPRQGRKVDGLTLWVANEWVPFWQNVKDNMNNLPRKKKAADEEDGRQAEQKKSVGRKPSIGAESTEKEEPPTLETYSEHRMLQFTSSVATVIACLLPTVAIAVLAKLHSTEELIGLIAVFTAVFAIGLMSLTDAGTSRVEIFTATAAFSAVMVVFVQNQNGTSNGT